MSALSERYFSFWFRYREIRDTALLFCAMGAYLGAIGGLLLGPACAYAVLALPYFGGRLAELAKRRREQLGPRRGWRAVWAVTWRVGIALLVLGMTWTYAQRARQHARCKDVERRLASVPGVQARVAYQYPRWGAWIDHRFSLRADRLSVAKLWRVSTAVDSRRRWRAQFVRSSLLWERPDRKGGYVQVGANDVERLFDALADIPSGQVLVEHNLGVYLYERVKNEATFGPEEVNDSVLFWYMHSADYSFAFGLGDTVFVVLPP